MALKDRWGYLLRQGSWIAAVSSLVTILGLFAAIFSSRNDRDRAESQFKKAMDARIIAEEYRVQAENASKEMEDLRNMNAAVLKSLEQVKRSGNRVSFSNLDPADRQSIEEIKVAEAKLDGRLGALETALMASPEKAVAVPMLKQEIDSLQDRTHSDLDGIRGEIGRLFTLTQWFIGLMFTIALGMFGLSFNLRRATAPPSEEKAKSTA